MRAKERDWFVRAKGADYSKCVSVLVQFKGPPKDKVKQQGCLAVIGSPPGAADERISKKWGVVKRFVAFLAQTVSERRPVEGTDAFQRVIIAIPKPDRRQRHTVKRVGLHHGIMGLIKKSETCAWLRRGG